ncbi:MAG: histidine kinase [Xanthomarina sp.]
MRVLLLNFLLIPFILFAQEPVVFQFTEKEGLPDIEFYNMIEDRKGFIWLAADKGFYRFDGKDFKNYSNEEKRSLSVFDPFEDKTGRIWCVNISGQLFYVENEKLITFIDLGNQFNGELVKYIVRDFDVLVFSRSKILSVNLKTKRITTIGDHLNSVGRPFCFDEKILICINNEIFKITENYLKKEETLASHIKLENNELEATFFQLQDHLFLLRQSLIKSREQVLYYKNAQFEEIEIPLELRNKRLNCYFEKDNYLWFGTNHGVYVYAFEAGKFKLIKKVLDGIFVTKIIIDKDENYWFTSLKSGLYVVPNINIGLQKIENNYGGISCLAKINENSFVFGTTNGKSGIYNINDKTINEIKLATGSKVTAVMKNSYNDEIFISQEDRSGVYKNKIYTVDNNFINAKKLSLIDSIKFVYATYDGAYVVNNRKEVKEALGDTSSYTRTYTSHYSMKTQKTYVGYVDDLVVYDNKYQPKKIKYKGKSIFALALTETTDGIVWASTFKDGVFGIVNDEVKIVLNKSNGLISNQTGILTADGNHIWIATDNGIQWYHSKTNTFKSLTKIDGISSYNITGIEVFDNEVVFSSNTGLLFINKEKVFKTTQSASIYFTRVEVNEKEVTLMSNYQWDYDKNTVKFNFHTNGFKSSEKHQYQYRLIGLDDKWIPLDIGADFVKYNSLQAGDYVFQISYLEGNDTVNQKEIRFQINSPFWHKWWFYLIIIGLSISLVLVYFNLKVQKLKKKQEEEMQKELINKKLVLSQLEALRSQMNPHFIFNVLNSIQEYIVFNNKELASSYLVKFSRLIRVYLEHSQQNEIALKEEISALKVYLELEKIRFEDVLDCEFYVDQNLSLEGIQIPSLFIQPYLENAIKHGLLHKTSDRRLKISFEKNKKTNYLICTIEDNGIGRKQASKINKNRQYQSFATSANEKRLQLINLNRSQKIVVDTIDLYSKDHGVEGTRVVIKIPIES